jgi:uncharacterized membrane protein
MLTRLSLAFGAYLVTGRTGALATLLYLGAGFAETMAFSLLLDLGQITLYGALLENLAGRDGKNFLSRSIARQQERWKARLKRYSRDNGLTRLRVPAVMVVTMVPFYGFGIHSACVVAFLLKFRPVSGTVTIMAGSLIASLLTWLVLFPFLGPHGL